MNTQLSTALAASLCFASLAAAPAHGQVTEDLKIVASDAAMSARFGYSTAAHGGRFVVGARGEMTNGDTSGAAYLFDVATGQELHKLLPTIGDVGDIFGNTVAINDSVVLVGADRENGDDDGVSFLTNSGAAYVFDAATGQQLFMLKASDALSHAHFAQSVALSGDLAAIGSNAINLQGIETGTTYVFDVTTGQELHKLLATDGEFEDRLGESVSISNGLIAAGAIGDDDNGPESGSAYVFDAVSGAQIAKLLPSDGAAQDFFGVSVAISGDRVVVGARRDDDNGTASGSAYVFDALTGQQLMKLLADDGEPNDNFGGFVAIDGSTVLVSAAQGDDNGNNSGAVYVFDLATGQQISKLVSTDSQTNHFFGYGLSINGDTAIIGSPFSSDAGTSSGSAYVFELDNGFGAVLSYCEPAGANSVSATGTQLTSVSGFGTSQATFALANVPDSIGILFTGNLATDVPFGCGRRCVGGSVLRGAIVTPTGNQASALPFDMSLSGTTHVQYWYRDNAGCGTGTNLSNALTR